MVESLGQPDQRECISRVERMWRDLRDEGDVLACCEARNQIVKLEHESNVFAAKTRQSGFVGIREHVIPKADVSCRGRIQPTEDVEQRGLAAAGRTEQYGEFPLVQLEIDATQRPDLHVTGPVDLGEPSRHECNGAF